MNSDDSAEPNVGGRPEWQPTKAQRRDAELYIATMSEEEVARVFGISVSTARIHLAEEFATGRAKRKAKITKLLWKNAEAGNVSAQKHLDGKIEMAATSRDEMARKVPALGKKEAALQDARTPDTSTTMGELMAQRQSPETVN